jgi:hypothetical protein
MGVGNYVPNAIVVARFQANCSDPRILAAAESPAAKAHDSAVQKAEAAAAGR